MPKAKTEQKARLWYVVFVCTKWTHTEDSRSIRVGSSLEGC